MCIPVVGVLPHNMRLYCGGGAHWGETCRHILNDASQHRRSNLKHHRIFVLFRKRPQNILIRPADRLDRELETLAGRNLGIVVHKS